MYNRKMTDPYQRAVIKFCFMAENAVVCYRLRLPGLGHTRTGGDDTGQSKTSVKPLLYKAGTYRINKLFA